MIKNKSYFSKDLPELTRSIVHIAMSQIYGERSFARDIAIAVKTCTIEEWLDFIQLHAPEYIDCVKTELFVLSFSKE